MASQSHWALGEPFLVLMLLQLHYSVVVAHHKVAVVCAFFSFQYRYQPGNLYALYQMYGGSEAHIFENTATHIINVAATNYTAYQFFK